MKTEQRIKRRQAELLAKAATYRSEAELCKNPDNTKFMERMADDAATAAAALLWVLEGE